MDGPTIDIHKERAASLPDLDKEERDENGMVKSEEEPSTTGTHVKSPKKKKKQHDSISDRKKKKSKDKSSTIDDLSLAAKKKRRRSRDMTSEKDKIGSTDNLSASSGSTQTGVHKRRSRSLSNINVSSLDPKKET